MIFHPWPIFSEDEVTAWMNKYIPQKAMDEITACRNGIHRPQNVLGHSFQ